MLEEEAAEPLDRELTEDEKEEITIINGRSLRRLMERPEWPTYVNMINARAELEEQATKIEFTNIEQVMVVARAQGRVSGLRLALSSASFMVEAAERLQEERTERDSEDVS